MTQEQLAEIMGYSHKSSINKIEMGKADLPQSKIVAFAKVLGVSPCYLLGITDEPEKVATTDDLNQWDEKYNKDELLHNDVLLIEGIQARYGKDAVKLLELFTKMNKQGQTKALDSLSDLASIEKYIKGE